MRFHVYTSFEFSIRYQNNFVYKYLNINCQFYWCTYINPDIPRVKSMKYTRIRRLQRKITYFTKFFTNDLACISAWWILDSADNQTNLFKYIHQTQSLSRYVHDHEQYLNTVFSKVFIWSSPHQYRFQIVQILAYAQADKYIIYNICICISKYNLFIDT